MNVLVVLEVPVAKVLVVCVPEVVVAVTVPVLTEVIVTDVCVPVGNRRSGARPGPIFGGPRAWPAPDQGLAPGPAPGPPEIRRPPRKSCVWEQQAELTESHLK